MAMYEKRICECMEMYIKGQCFCTCVRHVAYVRMACMGMAHHGTYKADGQVKKMIELLEHVVAMQTKVLEEEHPSQLGSP